MHDSENLNEYEEIVRKNGRNNPYREIVQRSSGKIIMGNLVFIAQKRLTNKTREDEARLDKTVEELSKIIKSSFKKPSKISKKIVIKGLNEIIRLFIKRGEGKR